MTGREKNNVLLGRKLSMGKRPKKRIRETGNENVLTSLPPPPPNPPTPPCVP